MANTLIVGAGWLGTPLAETLMKDGHHVVVTRRNQARLNELPASLTHSALFDFNQLNAAKRLDELLKQHKITHVVGAFPLVFVKDADKNTLNNGKCSQTQQSKTTLKSSL